MKMETIKIRRARKEDIKLLEEISKKTFFETFSEQNTEENMFKYLNDSFSPEKLSDELSDKNSQFFFAIFNDEIIGYSKLNRGNSQTDIKDDNTVELERIYILKMFQGKKAGQVLLDKAIGIAMQENASYLWLGVWENNYKAISFYRKNGFFEFSKHKFILGDDIQTDIMMKLEFI